LRLSELRDGWAVEPIRAGIALSGATIERWTKAGEPDRFHKSAAPTWDRGLDAEAARLRWLATTPLADRVATVVSHGIDDEDGLEHLVTTAVAGHDAAGLAEELEDDDTTGHEALARRCGAALRQLHDALDPATCPFDRTLDARLDAAARRVAEGGVDAADFEPEYADRTPSQLLELLGATRPDGEDLVVTHGDWCYPNVLFDGNGAWTMVDLADLGVACRWYDLGIGARSTSHNLGDEAIPSFFEGYGIDPDDGRGRYYLLLDELQ
jgi:aminoglycoside 3'-phosphotransferase-2